jgi:hypothetical protein
MGLETTCQVVVQLCLVSLYDTVVANCMDTERQVSQTQKKVLLISCFTPPVVNAEAILVWKTVRELERYFDMQVISSQLPAHARVDAQMTWPASVSVSRRPVHLPQQPFARKAMERTMGLVADEQYLWAALGKMNAPDCDLIYSRSHPGASHIAAYRVKQKLQKPWVAQFSDPWANNPYHANHTFVRKAVDNHYERLVIQSADMLIFPTEEIAQMYRTAYSSFDVAAKSLVLPHHYTPELYPNPHPNSALPDIFDEESTDLSRVSFAYFGDFYGLRSPAPFLEALQRLSQESPDVLERMTVSFYGNIESKFSSIVEQSPIRIATDRVSYLESLKRMSDTDVLLLVDAPSATGTNPFLASKVIDYLGAGRPIIGITDLKGTSPTILRKHGHDVVRPDDIQGIATAIARRIRETRTSLTPPSEFTTQHVVGQLASVINELTRQA